MDGKGITKEKKKVGGGVQVQLNPSCDLGDLKGGSDFGRYFACAETAVSVG